MRRFTTNFLQKSFSKSQNFLKMPNRRIRAVQWTEPYVDFLIDERRRRNDEYHNTYGSSRQEFWSSVARRFIIININEKINSFQCS